ncbi:DUF3494 domain-containing protein [Halopseudomonas nanhaiensis]|uniref:ice-binding family protein n=1 Tax=Halopseudomonas nanhaiensis TaxID=2830842 RepID=UPI001CBCB192|nr:ice-binding family protein [Halopseudomonas nanhaiensis]UAW98359.1 DUF3494 domain-containing protein [Halopseudomonas nanhaiensis]
MKKFLPAARLLAASAIVLSGLSLAGCLGGSSSNSDNNTGTGGDSPVTGTPGTPGTDSPTATPSDPIGDSDLIQAVRPISDSITVDTNKKLAVTFNQDMDGQTINGTSFLLQGETGPAVVGGVTYDPATRTAIFTPDSGLTDNTLYTGTLTTDVAGASGVTLGNSLSWQFTTGDTVDTTAPTVIFDPLDGDAQVAINRNLTATFSESMDPTTITASNFTLTTGGNPVPGEVSYLGSTAIFDPTADLLPGTLYIAMLTTAITDLATPANALAAGQTAEFTTDNSLVPAAGPEPVVLGTAGNFVILSKTGITTTGTTAITGDIGVSPIDEAAITGFSQARDATDTFSTSSLVTGKIFAANMAAPTPSYLTTAISDMELAFTNAAGRTNPAATELGAGDISGETMAPGLYKWGTSVQATSDVTFDGGPNDVWIMQIEQDLLLGSGVAVQLTGGARAENVFWQVAGQVTLRTGATLQGILLSKTQIVMETGATLNGRALAQTLVTLDAVTATQPE